MGNHIIGRAIFIFCVPLSPRESNQPWRPTDRPTDRQTLVGRSKTNCARSRVEKIYEPPLLVLTDKAGRVGGHGIFSRVMGDDTTVTAADGRTPIDDRVSEESVSWSKKGLLRPPPLHCCFTFFCNRNIVCVPLSPTHRPTSSGPH